MHKTIIFSVLVGTIIGVVFAVNHFEYSKQADQFVRKCHSEKGVVIEEYDTDNLLCFPADA